MTKAFCCYVTDVDGAPEFERQAHAFAKMYGCTPVPFKPWEHATVESALAREASLELVAILCHGFRERLMTGHATAHRLAQQLPGDRRLSPVDALARAIAQASVSAVRVLLDACSTGSDSVGVDGDGGFADELRDLLGVYHCDRGWVDAHNTAGNAATNPYVRRFYTDGDPLASPGQGGGYIVAPREALWPAWRAAVKTDFRFRFPTQSVDAIRASLRG